MALRCFLSLSLLFPALVMSQIRWQTTHNGSDWGSCALEVNKINVTIHSSYINVEEEAVIGTRGTVWRGDEETLEIFGDFQLAEGAALRSMLLWNGEDILKARLKDRTMADSAYEDVVDRDNPDPVVIDPALIEYMGNNRYEFKIYPVEINKSRKIRILYTIPLQVNSQNMSFTLRTAFSDAAGISSEMTHVPVTVRLADDAFERYYFEYGQNRKIVRSGLTYLIPYQDVLYKRLMPMRLVPEVEWDIAYTRFTPSGQTAGHYTAIFCHIPDSVKGYSLQHSGNLIEAVIRSNSKMYSVDFLGDSLFCAYLKSDSPWDSTINWSVYDSAGEIAYEYSHRMVVESTDNDMLPVIWAAKYSLAHGQEPLGQLYGFVDPIMSLLALEEDTLSTELVALYAEEGVPELFPEEIITDSSNLTYAPRENIIIEIPSSTKDVLANTTLLNRVDVLGNGCIAIQLGTYEAGKISVDLFDLRGRKIHGWKDVKMSGKMTTLRLPGKLKGFYVLRVTVGKETVQKRVLMK